jgi:Flp pilus assembly protein TadD
MPERPLAEYFNQLRSQYLAAARRGRWHDCFTIAERLKTFGLGTRDDAEAVCAAGYAHEQLGDLRKARSHYELTLILDRRHAKARRRLAAVVGQGMPRR